MVKPLKIFLYLLSLLAILAIISINVPSKGFKIGNYTIKYPTLLELLDLDTAQRPTEFSLHPELAMLDKALENITNLNFGDTAQLWEEPDTILFADTIQVDSVLVVTKKQSTEPSLTAEILKNRFIAIETNDSTLHALESFFSALHSGAYNKQQVRVMHYGDSQIEGDRITSFLRSRLQARFGGRGVGLLHAVPHSYQPGAVNQTISGNWKQTLLPDLGKGALEHRFGILGGYSEFTTTRSFGRGGFTEAWIRIQRRGSQQSNARNFNRFRLFYGFAKEPFMLSLSYGGVTQDGDMIAPSNSINQVNWEVPVGFNSIQIDFKGDASPLVFGLSLESKTGVIVDNIPIRGSSGNDFTRADDRSLAKALQLIDPKLIILQFGVNVVPHIVASYQYYENQMYQQIVALKRIKPDASVILIGVSDMSRREGGRFVSYPNIEKIRDAQRNAAFRAGAAFWDCYSAMGGQNSMPAWVYTDPPLASKDFVHFTLRGSNLVAEMFYSSLMKAYEEFTVSKEID
jgi:lysophospholipase L1-like esterase